MSTRRVNAPWGSVACTLARACMLAATIATRARCAEKPWDVSPYRVLVTLAVDAGPRPQPLLEATVCRSLSQRCEGAFKPLWAPDIVLAADARARRDCFDPPALRADDLPQTAHDFDKLMWLGVKSAPDGYRLTCREYDAFTRRWGSTLQRTTPQSSYLYEACFRALADAFTPVARVETSDSASGRVRLAFRGAALPSPPGAELLVRSGDVFLPLQRRTSRTGQVVEGGIAPVPWTFLIADRRPQNGWTAEINSALRRPFAGRRRGLVELVAIGLRRGPEPVRLRFYARRDAKQGLAGYEVLRLDNDGSPPELLGTTDGDGYFELPPDTRGVTALLLRSEGQVVAKLLAAPGVADIVQAPIADDHARVTAQSELQGIREELIDVVARRAMLTARVKALLSQNRLEDARESMSELNSLPTLTVFMTKINAAVNRTPKSDDPQVSRTIEQLFSSTRTLLMRYLDAGPITSLQAEVNQASARGS